MQRETVKLLLPTLNDIKICLFLATVATSKALRNIYFVKRHLMDDHVNLIRRIYFN